MNQAQSPLLFQQHKVIDIDTHLTEPGNLFTSRVASKWKDQVPHVKRVDGKDFWFIGDKSFGCPGAYSMAGHDFPPPNYPESFDVIPKSMMEPQARLDFMDEEDIYAQILYPNVAGFGAQRFLDLKDPELMLECVRAYNDFLHEWVSTNPNRLVPVCAIPYWDMDATMAELERCQKLGFRSVLMCIQPQDFDLPNLRNPHWNRLWAFCQEAGMTISFHIGGGDLTEVKEVDPNLGYGTNFGRFAVLAFVGNTRCITDLVFGGVCHRFPNLKFVSVESGAGWLPFLIEAMDWQWKNCGVTDEHPDYDLLPSEYFKRQIYGSFWFERDTIHRALELYPDNIMYQTDYPHPTCMAPGPASAGVRPKEYAQDIMADLPDDLIAKVLHDTAAELYGLE